MTRLWLIAALLTGCFYTESLNQRPSLEIHWDDQGALSRGMTPHFSAVAIDPDDDAVKLTWRAYACHGKACDQAEFDSGADVGFSPTLPRYDANGDSYDTLEIRLEGRDSLGATARPSQVYSVPLDDAAPVVEMRADPHHNYVVGIPVGVYARVSDVDDDPLTVGIDWQAYAPPMAIANDTLTDHAPIVDDDPTRFKTYAKTFTPNAIGDWQIHTAVMDPLGHQAENMVTIHVDNDHPPCLAQWAPAATTAPGTSIPLTDPTLFQVLVVADDLDPFPPINDPITGTTSFHWSIVPPGGTRQQLSSVTGPAVALDPGNYRPGDFVELRVEIQDRNAIAVNCPDGDLTCSVISDPTCLQRMTWRAEVR